MILKYIKQENDNYKTLRQVLDSQFKISYVLRLKLKRNNHIFVNGENTYLDHELMKGDTITVDLDFDEENSNIVPSKMNLNIIYEDDAILVLNKPAGVAIHPSMRHFEDTLSNGVKYYFDSINLKRKIRPVNRLDSDTSGVVIFAKNEYVHSVLSNEMQKGLFKKEYIAICTGIFDKKDGTINASIGRKNDSIIERCVRDDGQEAITHYRVLNEFCNNDIAYSELLINLETGRTHQIRVHTAYIGHSILGDSLYGNKSNLINRQALHAYKVEFIHPITNKRLEFIAPIPDDMKLLLN